MRDQMEENRIRAGEKMKGGREGDKIISARRGKRERAKQKFTFTVREGEAED